MKSLTKVVFSSLFVMLGALNTINNQANAAMAISCPGAMTCPASVQYPYCGVNSTDTAVTSASKSGNTYSCTAYTTGVICSFVYASNTSCSCSFSPSNCTGIVNAAKAAALAAANAASIKAGESRNGATGLSQVHSQAAATTAQQQSCLNVATETIPADALNSAATVAGTSAVASMVGTVTLTTTANGGVLCPGVYNATAICLATGAGCGGSSCGWGAGILSYSSASSGAGTTVSTRQYHNGCIASHNNICPNTSAYITMKPFTFDASKVVAFRVTGADPHGNYMEADTNGNNGNGWLIGCTITVKHQ